MKTAEEILNEILADVENRPVFFREQDVVDLIAQAQKEAYSEGYNEAMRWKKPSEELPKEGMTVQVQIFNGHDNILEYIYDEYLGKNKWRKCTSKYIEIIGWRPLSN